MTKSSIWSTLTRSAPVDTKSQVASTDRTSISASIELDDDWLSLTRPDFLGPAVLSPNKRWAVGYLEPPRAMQGQLQQSGRTVLVDMDHKRVLHDAARFRRPMEVAVSDSGLYVVHDTGFESKLQADLLVVSITGEILVRRRYEANLINIGLSPCGRYVVTQAANAYGGPDGSKLELLDIQTRKRLFSVLPPTGWADRYSFKVADNGELKFLSVHLKQLGSFRYTPDGTFLEQEKFDESRLSKGDYTQRILTAKDLLKADNSPATASKVLRTIDSALALGAKDRPDWTAVACRVQGEAYEALGQLSEALDAYRKALAANPKIGVRKKVDSIEKKLHWLSRK